MLEDEAHQKMKLEGEIALLQSQLLQISFEADEVRCIQNFFAHCGFVLSLLFFHVNYPPITPFRLFPWFFRCVSIPFKISVSYAMDLLVYKVASQGQVSLYSCWANDF